MTDEDAARRLNELLDWIKTQPYPAGPDIAAKLVPYLGDWAKRPADGGPTPILGEVVGQLMQLGLTKAT